MSAIELRNTTKNFPGFTLGPIDLSIEQGEFFGIFGPPSSGKTSILKLILGLLRQDEGRIRLSGVDCNDLEVSQRRISMVFQNLALFPHMTGRENIIFPLAERGASNEEITRRLDFVSEVLHVSHILHKNPSQMSGGERQRIALGRALADDSRAIFLDEPISALDARLREDMRVELKRLQRTKNQTFVYVSHDEEEVMAISDRVAVMIDGQIAQVGQPDEVYNYPNSIGVAEVIGTPPMNFFSGTFSTDGKYFESEEFARPISISGQVRPGEKGTLGVRPEDIHDANQLKSDDRGCGCHRISISSVEPLGSHTIINAELGSKLIKIRAEGRIIKPDDHTGEITFDQRRIHLFDKNDDRLSKCGE